MKGRFLENIRWTDSNNSIEANFSNLLEGNADDRASYCRVIIFMAS